MSCGRRDFIGGGIAALAALPGARLLPAADSGFGVVPASAFDYWCTWGIQNATSRVGSKGRRDKTMFAGDQGALLARDNISEELLFGAKGWARTMFPRSRRNLYMMIDDGWDVPFGTDPAKSMRPFSALVPSADRFPGLGATGEERLANIDARFRENGWLAAAWGREVFQTAPAAMSRGMALPEVKSLEAEAPFVAAMSHPNGTLSVGAFPRVTGGRMWTPRAEIALDADVHDGMTLGVFGVMSSLRLKGRLDGRRVCACDLAGGETHDITASVAEADGQIRIPGEVLAQIGREAAPRDQRSAPGALVRVVSRKDAS